MNKKLISFRNSTLEKEDNITEFQTFCSATNDLFSILFNFANNRPNEFACFYFKMSRLATKWEKNRNSE